MLAEDNLSNGDTITPTWNNITAGNASINTITYYRTGNRMKAQGHIKLGSTSSISGAMGIDIPAGLTVDTSKATNFQSVGVVWGVDSATGRFEGILFVSDSNTLVVSSTDGTNSNWSGTKPFTWTTNDEFYVDFEVPILEWNGSQNSLVGYSLASVTQTGLVSTGAQEFSGDKNFNDNVGVGISNPAYQVHVRETSANAEIAIEAGDSNNSSLWLNRNSDLNRAGIIYAHSTDTMIMRSNDADRVTINSSGNVGIGGITAAAPFEVKTSTANYRLQITHTSGQNQLKSLDGNQSTYRSLYYDAASHVFQGSGSTRVVIDGSGNVGIGTTNPIFPLEVRGSGASLCYMNTTSTSTGYMLGLQTAPILTANLSVLSVHPQI
jgi:hypothetical protein